MEENRCIICGVDLGSANPRQYCRKTYCPLELELPEPKVPDDYFIQLVDGITIDDYLRFCHDRSIIFFPISSMVVQERGYHVEGCAKLFSQSNKSRTVRVLDLFHRLHLELNPLRTLIIFAIIIPQTLPIETRWMGSILVSQLREMNANAYLIEGAYTAYHVFYMQRLCTLNAKIDNTISRRDIDENQPITFQWHELDQFFEVTSSSSP